MCHVETKDDIADLIKKAKLNNEQIKQLVQILNDKQKSDAECYSSVLEFLRKNASKIFHAVVLGAISGITGANTPYYDGKDVNPNNIAHSFAMGAGWGALVGTVGQGNGLKISGGTVISGISGAAAVGTKYISKDNEGWINFTIVILLLLLELIISVISFMKHCMYSKKLSCENITEG